jgi:hypothetical protein
VHEFRTPARASLIASRRYPYQAFHGTRTMLTGVGSPGCAREYRRRRACSRCHWSHSQCRATLSASTGWRTLGNAADIV